MTAEEVFVIYSTNMVKILIGIWCHYHKQVVFGLKN